jgi:hypothetical protein
VTEILEDKEGAEIEVQFLSVQLNHIHPAAVLPLGARAVLADAVDD